MLNRHFLRAKALQYLYALHNSKRADLLLAEDYLTEAFIPTFSDSNQLEPAMVEAKQKKAKMLLHRLLEGHSLPTETEPDIAGHVRKAFKDYRELCQKDNQKLGRVMMDETMAIYDRFLMILCFLRELGELCHEKSQLTGVLGEDKKERLDYFYDSAPIKSLRESKNLSDLFIRHRIGWQGHGDFVEAFYKNIFRQSDLTKKILSSPRPPEKEAQIEWVEHVAKDLFFPSPITDSFFEDLDSNWQENKSIVKNMLYKTLKRIYESEDNSWTPVTLTPDWDEDRGFFEKIYQKTVEEEARLSELLVKYLENWDLERVTVVDVVIIRMALTEMIHFPSIPIKVTINEFIELAKRYSTPRSKEFVNGLLDRISKDFKEEGLIKKSGRGLLDNA
jgi:transcription antitermination protein NusB